MLEETEFIFIIRSILLLLNMKRPVNLYSCSMYSILSIPVYYCETLSNFCY